MTNIKDILEKDVHDEEFLIPFHKMVEKFVHEFDDMAQMESIKHAKALLDQFNNQ